MLIQANEEKELNSHVKAVLGKARERGITFSKNKVQYGRFVKYAGFIINSVQGSTTQILPDPALLSAIREFRKPTNVTELKSFLGMQQQITAWNPDLSQHMVKMRSLLKKDIDWRFDEMTQEFEVAEENLTKDQKLTPFDPKLECKVLTDASRQNGLGFCLIQKKTDGTGFNIIHCGSCSLNNAQRNYATLELEALGVNYAVVKCDYYLRGRDNLKSGPITSHSLGSGTKISVISRT